MTLARLTTAAQQALTHAAEHARSLSGDDERPAGPQHLVLGIFQAGGVAAYLLEIQGITAAKLLAQTDAIAPHSPHTPAPHSPDTHSPDTPSSDTPDIQPIITAAAAIADAHTHQQIGSDHILLALVDTPGPHHDLFTRLGVELPVLRSDIAERMDAVRPENLLASDVDTLFGDS